jgi:sodium--glutamate symport carrier gltS
LFSVVPVGDYQLFSVPLQRIDPLIAILMAQVVLMMLFAYVVAFPLLGRDYDAAVLCAGIYAEKLEGLTRKVPAKYSCHICHICHEKNFFTCSRTHIGAFFVR